MSYMGVVRSDSPNIFRHFTIIYRERDITVILTQKMPASKCGSLRNGLHSPQLWLLVSRIDCSSQKYNLLSIPGMTLIHPKNFKTHKTSHLGGRAQNKNS